MHFILIGFGTLFCTSTFVQAIVLGVFGSMDFTLNDGTIVLFSDRYNLGRLDSLTDLYFNDGEDVYTTIEKDSPTPTLPPVAPPTPVPETRSPKPTEPEDDDKKYFNATITFIPPEEALDKDLPGAITWTNEDVYGVEGSDPDEGSVVLIDEGSESEQEGDFGSDQESSGEDNDEPLPDPMPGSQEGDFGSDKESSGEDNDEPLQDPMSGSQEGESGSDEESSGEENDEALPDPMPGSQEGDSGSDEESSGEDKGQPLPDPMPGSPGGGSGSGSGTGSGSGSGTGSSSGSTSDIQQSTGNDKSGSEQVGGSNSGQAVIDSSSSDSAAKQEATKSNPEKKLNNPPNSGSVPAQTVPRPTSSNSMRRRETIQVKLIWGVKSTGKKLNLWVTNSDEERSEMSDEESPSINLADPTTQAWLVEVAGMAKANPQLFVRQDKLTWIERLQDFTKYAGVEFPIPEHLFSTYLQLLKFKDSSFATSIQSAIGTSSPGLGGEYTFASLTMMVDAVEAENAAQNISISEQIYTEWTAFAAEINELSPPGVPDVVAQSSIFLDAYRVDATIDSTLVTWFVANGLCLLVILLFIQNISLSFMVMVTILLILFCLGGLLFSVYRVPFGPVEALGVSIFIGLSANYS